MIKLERRRIGDYIVTEPFNNKRYVFTGAKGNMKCALTVPEDVYNWLLMSTSAITDGDLVRVDINKDEEQLSDILGEDIAGEIENNTHTRAEIEEILLNSKTVKAMAKKLEVITNEEEKRFVLEVAKDINLDSSIKRNYIKEWLGIKDLTADEIFTKDEN